MFRVVSSFCEYTINSPVVVRVVTSAFQFLLSFDTAESICFSIVALLPRHLRLFLSYPKQSIFKMARTDAKEWDHVLELGYTSAKSKQKNVQCIHCYGKYVVTSATRVKEHLKSCEIYKARRNLNLPETSAAAAVRATRSPTPASDTMTRGVTPLTDTATFSATPASDAETPYTLPSGELRTIMIVCLVRLTNK